MQEEVENRTLTLVVSGTKFTGRLLKAAISKYMAHCKEKKLQKQRSRDAPVTPHGKQTVKQIIGQNQGISNIEITDPSIKEFEKIARKYGVDYAVKKDRSSSPPKYLIFFKGRDADALTAAFTEYTSKKVKKAEKTERPSVLAKLSQFKEMVKNAVTNVFDPTENLEKYTPVVKMLPGWKTDISNCRSYDELPVNAKRYINFLEDMLRHEIQFVSVGAERNQYLLNGKWL